MRVRQIVGIIAISVLSACTIYPGRVLLTRPHVYDSQTTRDAIVNSGKFLSQAMRASGALKLDSVQQGSTILQMIATSGRFGQVAGGVPPAPVPSGSANPEPAAAPTPVLPTAMSAPAAAVASVATSGFGRTVEEQIEDLVHTEAVVRGIELGHGALDRTSRFGPKARVYLVELDVNPIPRRQSYWLYPILLLQSGLASVYNFTQTWFTQVEFQLPVAPDPDGSLVRVYDIDPKHAVVTANDSLTNVSQLQLAALISSPTATGQADYFNRLEEAFGEQRRYPQQLGWHDGAGAFVWTFGPRRQIVQRHWLHYLNPFLSKYRVVSRLEPGLRQGFALIVVPDVDALRDSIQAEAHFACTPDLTENQHGLAARTVDELEARDEYRTYETYRDEDEVVRRRQRLQLVSKAYCEAAGRTSADKIVVPIVVSARHLMLDRPDQAVAATLQGTAPIDLSNAQVEKMSVPSRGMSLTGRPTAFPCAPGNNVNTSGRRCPGVLFMELPIAPSELANPKTTVVITAVGPAKVEGKADPQRMAITVKWNGNFVAEPPVAVDVQYASEDGEWRSLPTEVLEVRKSELLVATLKPQKPKTVHPVRLRASVRADRWTYGSRYDYLYPDQSIGWLPDSESTANVVSIRPASGMPGMRVTLSLAPYSGRAVTDIDKVQFGTIDLAPGAWMASPDGSSLSFQVPVVPPAQPIEGKASCHAVDVVVVFKTPPSTSSARFVYEASCKVVAGH